MYDLPAVGGVVGRLVGFKVYICQVGHLLDERNIIHHYLVAN